ncbi:DUF192 domain-containing protein [Rhodovibrionaceae bacterium A322]
MLISFAVESLAPGRIGRANSPKRFWQGVLLAFAVILGLVMAGAGPAVAQEVTFERDVLEIVTQSGARHSFSVEVAQTSEQMAQGLMYRQDLAPDAGMIFLHKRAKIAAMWMKNTFISLDMLFIDSKGRVQKIAKRTVPLSEKTIASNRRVLAVLELKGGTADRLGLAVGDRVEHPAFQNR